MKLTRLATVVIVLAAAGCFIATAIAVVVRRPPAAAHSKPGRRNREALVIAGDLSRDLYPGARPVAINLVLKNHRRHAVTLTSVAVSIKAVRAPHATPSLPCTIRDFAVGGYRGSFKAPPGRSTLRRDGVPIARWPTLRMVNRSANQDGCKGATVELAYRGLARERRVG
jgi:hypothetical protein